MMDIFYEITENEDKKDCKKEKKKEKKDNKKEKKDKFHKEKIFFFIQLSIIIIIIFTLLFCFRYIKSFDGNDIFIDTTLFISNFYSLLKNGTIIIICLLFLFFLFSIFYFLIKTFLYFLISLTYYIMGIFILLSDYNPPCIDNHPMWFGSNVVDPFQWGYILILICIFFFCLFGTLLFLPFVLYPFFKTLKYISKKGYDLYCELYKINKSKNEDIEFIIKDNIFESTQGKYDYLERDLQKLFSDNRFFQDNKFPQNDYDNLHKTPWGYIILFLMIILYFVIFFYFSSTEKDKEFCLYNMFNPIKI